MTLRRLRPDPQRGFIQVVGVGGIGTGTIFALQGNHTLGRNESRMAAIVDARDYCKLHIVEHYLAALFDLSRHPEACKVVAVGNVGTDSAGVTLIREMQDIGIDTRQIRIEPESRTMCSVVFLYPDLSGGNITASNSASSLLSTDQLVECRQLLAEAASRGIALCLPEAPLEKRAEFLRIATECGSYRIASFAAAEIDPARRLKLLANVDLLALNREEAIELAGHDLKDSTQAQLLQACSEIAVAMNPSIAIVISAGSEGAHVFERGHWSTNRSIPVDVISTAGAGDALLAGAITGLIAGMPLADPNGLAVPEVRSINSAIDLGLALAAFSVTSAHTIHPEATLESLLSFAASHGFSLGQNIKQLVIT
ncbi:MAG: carbohydrate kinase family protein [Acidobacteriota bacterium]